MHPKDLADVTRIIQTNKPMAGQLKTLMADDVPWSALLDRVRSTGQRRRVTLTTINGLTVEAQAATARPAPPARARRSPR